MDWTMRIREALTSAEYVPDADVIEELAQHAASMYDTALERGYSRGEAEQLVAAQIDAWRQDAVALHRKPRRPSAPTLPPAPRSRLAGALNDVRYAVRSLMRARGFTISAVTTLGIGMALCATAMIVFDAYLLRDLPYPAAERLYWVRYAAPGQSQPEGLAQLDWEPLDDIIEHRVSWDLDMFYLLGGEYAESAPGAWVTRGFIEALGIPLALGRGLDDEAFATGENVALISHRLWQTRFNGDPNVIGRTFTAYVSDRPEEAESFEIRGVLPADFWHINRFTDVIVPLRVTNAQYMVRLREGVSPEQAAARITTLVRAGATGVPADYAVTLEGAHERHVEAIRPMLRASVAAALLVLLVACANVAALLLVRAAARQRDAAIRVALGAGRAALARIPIAEAFVIGACATLLAGAVTAFVLSRVGPVVQQQIGRNAPGGALAFMPSARMLVVMAALGLVTMVTCAIVPLATSLRPRLAAAFQSVGRAATFGVSSQRTRAVLIVAQLSVSMALLCGSVLMLRTVAALANAPFGYSFERVTLVNVPLRQARYPDHESRTAVQSRIVDALRAVPGVEFAALTRSLPLQEPSLITITTDGDTEVRAPLAFVGEGYFETLAIRVAGRSFARMDGIGSEPIAIISSSLAERLWPGGRAIGNMIRLSTGNETERGIARRVIGVADDIRQSPTDTDLTDVYIPLSQESSLYTNALVRAVADPTQLLPALRTAIHDIDPEIAVDNARPLQAFVDDALARPRFLTALLSVFAACALLLALVGVYGMMAYAVRQREREIAIRVAIGAQPARVTRLFMKQGGLVLAVGLVLGVAGAVAIGRLLESQLVGVTADDPVTFAVVAIAFAVIALGAIWWPSRRAAGTDPGMVLRSE